ncbi:MAG: FmdE family protein [Bacillota bacterium]
MCKEPTLWEKSVDFHGHVCPGLAIGYRVAEIALERINENRSEDEELVTIVENDACGIDAVMVVTGCTLGKGNLLFKDTGKQVYTFGSRTSGKALRIALKEDVLKDRDDGLKNLHEKVMNNTATAEERETYSKKRMERIDKILHMPAEELVNVREIDFQFPEKARLFASHKCAECGEYAMEARIRVQNGQYVCMDCFNDYSRTIKV